MEAGPVVRDTLARPRPALPVSLTLRPVSKPCKLQQRQPRVAALVAPVFVVPVAQRLAGGSPSMGRALRPAGPQTASV